MPYVVGTRACLCIVQTEDVCMLVRLNWFTDSSHICHVMFPRSIFLIHDMMSYSFRSVKGFQQEFLPYNLLFVVLEQTCILDIPFKVSRIGLPVSFYFELVIWSVFLVTEIKPIDLSFTNKLACEEVKYCFTFHMTCSSIYKFVW